MALSKVELCDLICELWNPMVAQIAYGRPFVLPEPDAKGNRNLQGGPFHLLWKWLMPFSGDVVRRAMELELAESRPDIRRVPKQAEEIQPKAGVYGHQQEDWNPPSTTDLSNVCRENLAGDTSDFARHVCRVPDDGDWDSWFETTTQLIEQGRTRPAKGGGTSPHWRSLIPKYRVCQELMHRRIRSEGPLKWRAWCLMFCRFSICLTHHKRFAIDLAMRRHGFTEAELTAAPEGVNKVLGEIFSKE